MGVRSSTESTRQALARSGLPVVLLWSSIRSLARRVGDGRGRPLLAGDPRQRLAELAAAREPLYRAVATNVVLTDRRSSAKVAAEILALLEAPAVTAMTTRIAIGGGGRPSYEVAIGAGLGDEIAGLPRTALVGASQAVIIHQPSVRSYAAQVAASWWPPAVCRRRGSRSRTAKRPRRSSRPRAAGPGWANWA